MAPLKRGLSFTTIQSELQGDFGSMDLSELKHNQIDTILMDLNLPGADGFSFLKQFKSSPATKHIPVIVWTTSDQPRDIQNSYAGGANSFVTKPMGLRDVTELIKDVCHYWFDRATLA